MSAPWRIQLLGGLRATQGERSLTHFRTQKTGLLLAYLAYYPQRAHPREELIELLWPGCEPHTGRNNLRVALSSLRHQLEPPANAQRGCGCVLAAERAAVQMPPGAVSSDVAAFETALAATAQARSSIERLQRLDEAVGRYQGELLPGYFEAWILPERQRLAEAHQQALQQLIREWEEAGDLPRAIQWARRAVCADSLNEEGHHQLIRLLAAAGQTEAAWCQYHELERLLAQELGVEPAPEIRALVGELPAVRGDERARGPGGDRQTDRVDGLRVLLPSGRRPVSPSLPRPLVPSHRPSLPTGTVTLLLTEIEGGAVLREWLGPTFAEAQEAHRTCLLPVFARHGGWIIRETADAFAVVFAEAGDALAAAVAGQRALASYSWPAEIGALRVRMALHTGDVEAAPESALGEPGGPGSELGGPVLQHATRLLLAARGGQILLSAVTAALLRSHPGPDRSMLDLGLYRLHEESAPERLFQWQNPGQAAAECSPVLALSAASGRLPREVTRFFGREEELTRLCALLGHAAGGGYPPEVGGQTLVGSEDSPTPLDYRLPTADCRLITLTGPGGSGKTRLALAAAARLGETFQGATWFVPLQDLAPPAPAEEGGGAARRLILDRVLEVLQLPRSPQREPLEQVAAFFSSPRSTGTRPSLLLLDNFEQLVDEGAVLVRSLLDRVETLVVLVTSRQRLSLAGEREFPVPPLSVPVESRKLRVECSAKPDPSNPSDRSDSSELSTLNSQLSTLAACPSVALFVDRARAARPDFQITAANAAAVAELCVRLEGLPLAIELAAARAGVLTPQQMLTWLQTPETRANVPPASGGCPSRGRFELLTSRQRDQSVRHRSLRAALDWSYRLLSPELQRFFSRLSIFRGGFTLEAAAAVCCDFGFRVPGTGCRVPNEVGCGQVGRLDFGLPTEQGEPDRPVPLTLSESIQNPNAQRAPEIQNTLECLDQLRECSLVLAAETGIRGEGPADRKATFTGLTSGAALRFQMLETLREYAAEQLEADEAAALAQRHLDYYVTLVQAAAPELIHGDEALWLERLEQEHANLRAAMDYALAAGSAEEGLRLAGAQWRFWALRDHVSEWRQRLAILLARPEAESRSPARARALLSAASLANCQHDILTAAPLAEESLEICRELGDDPGIARALNLLGIVAEVRGDGRTARMLFVESLQISHEAGDLHSAAFALTNLGNLTHTGEDLAAALQLHEESLALLRTLGCKASICLVLGNIGAVSRQRGDLGAARSAFAEGLALARELGNRSGVGFWLESLGEMALLHHDYAEAEACFEEGLAIMRQLDEPRGMVVRLFLLGLATLGQGDRCRAAALCRESLQIFRQRGQTPPRLRLGEWLRETAHLVTELAVSLPPGPDVNPNGPLPAAGDPPPGGFFSSAAAHEWAVRLHGAAAAQGFSSVAVHEWAARLRGAATPGDGSGAPPSLEEECARNPSLAALRAALGEPRFRNAWSESQEQPWERAATFPFDVGSDQSRRSEQS
jgi:predicted ATPase/DNA-binding SARP family transcriptional activator